MDPGKMEPYWGQTELLRVRLTGELKYLDTFLCLSLSLHKRVQICIVCAECYYGRQTSEEEL